MLVPTVTSLTFNFGCHKDCLLKNVLLYKDLYMSFFANKVSFIVGINVYVPSLLSGIFLEALIHLMLIKKRENLQDLILIWLILM